MDSPDPTDSTSAWNGLYKAAGLLTPVVAALFLFDVVAWIVLGPLPANAEGWFSLLRQDRLRALVLLSFPTLLGTLLYVLMFLALYRSLRAVNSAWATLAALLAFVGLGILVVTNMSYPMVRLGERYAGAATATERSLYLAAGEWSIADAAAGVNLGGFLVEGAALAFALLMLRSSVFGKVTAWLGVIGHGLDFARIAMNLAFVPERFGAVLLMIGGWPQLLWLILVGRGLFQLGTAGRRSG